MPALRRGAGRIALLGATALIVLGSSGCGPAQKAATAGTTAAPAPATTTTTTTTAPSSSTTTPTKPDGAAAQHLVAAVALTGKDLVRGFKLHLFDQGDQVKGQVTLDNCGYHYSTEAHRIARLQSAILTSKGEYTGASNEVVVYDSEAEAAKALQEFRDSVRTCRKNTYLKSAVASVPKMRYLTDTLSSDSRLPVEDNAIAIASAQVKGHSTKFYNISILQRRGTVLDNVYLTQPAKIVTADKDAMLQLAAVTGDRLARLAQASTI